MTELKMVHYTHAKNGHSVEYVLAMFPRLLDVVGVRPNSVLDVGTGLGDWAVAAKQSKIDDVYGVDGIKTAEAQARLGDSAFRRINLEEEFDLARRFDLVLCFEVAEHLPESSADNLISSLTRHADTILFSAALPFQGGDHHINCQPPGYWQTKFNQHGYACSDEVRSELYTGDEDDHWWYVQNIFTARRSPESAGGEPRLKYFVHPACVRRIIERDEHSRLGRVRRAARSLGKHLRLRPEND